MIEVCAIEIDFLHLKAKRITNKVKLSRQSSCIKTKLQKQSSKHQNSQQFFAKISDKRANIKQLLAKPWLSNLQILIKITISICMPIRQLF